MSWTLTERTESAPVADRLAADVLAGIAMDPPTIPPKWFYDEKGSQLFDDITTLPEYYPTRTEEAILTSCAAELARLTGADTLVELGSGYSRKTKLLLDALTAGDRGDRELLFVPLDVAAEPIRDAASRIDADYPTVTTAGMVADFDDELGPFPTLGTRLVAFLGSTIGNLFPPARADFLARVHRSLDPGDWFLLGADLVKDPGRLVAAYDDSAGVTAAFNKNVLHVLARELDADLDPDDFDHVAVWNEADERIEMRLRATKDVVVDLRGIDRRWSLKAGEEVLTETSHKFRVPKLQAELEAAGFTVAKTWTDDADDFSLTVAQVR